jgi:hypothetical protein
MTVKNLLSMLESFADDSEIVIEITKENGETITTYAIGYDCSESGELTLQVHE